MNKPENPEEDDVSSYDDESENEQDATEYERQRLERINRNQQLLETLGLKQPIVRFFFDQLVFIIVLYRPSTRLTLLHQQNHQLEVKYLMKVREWILLRNEREKLSLKWSEPHHVFPPIRERPAIMNKRSFLESNWKMKYYPLLLREHKEKLLKLNSSHNSMPNFRKRS